MATSASGSGPSRAAADVELLTAGQLEGLSTQIALAVQLSWWPLVIGNDLARAAQAKAREHKAKLYVHSGRDAAVGLARLRKAQLRQLRAAAVDGKAPRLLAAARLFAQLKPIGVAAAVLPWTGGQVYLVATNNGAPLRDHDAIVAPDRAQEMLTALRGRFSDQLVVQASHDCAAAVPELERGAAGALEWEDLVGVAHGATAAAGTPAPAELRALSGGDGALRRLPGPVKWLLVALILVLLAQGIVVPVVKKALARRAAEAQNAEDPVELWQTAYADWLAGLWVGTGAGLRQALAGIAGQQLVLGGWQLAGLSCKLGAGGQGAPAGPTGSGIWTCTGDYRRPADSRATNADLAAALPKGVSVEFSDLTRATVRFQQAGTLARLAPQTLPTRQAHNLGTASSLQRLQPVLKLEAKAIGDYATVPVPAPRLRSGATAPLPAVLKLPLVAKVTVAGPLRSMSALADLPVAWHTLTLTTVPKGELPAALDKADRITSPLNATLAGDLYAQP